MQRRQLTLWLLTLAVGTALATVATEGLSRWYFADKRLYRFDTRLGWAPKSDFNYTGLRRNAAGAHHAAGRLLADLLQPFL